MPGHRFTHAGPPGGEDFITGRGCGTTGYRRRFFRGKEHDGGASEVTRAQDSRGAAAQGRGGDERSADRRRDRQRRARRCRSACAAHARPASAGRCPRSSTRRRCTRGSTGARCRRRARPRARLCHVHRELARPRRDAAAAVAGVQGRPSRGLAVQRRSATSTGAGSPRQELVLRQEHAPGDKLFVDYAGQTVPIVDRYTGEVRDRADLRRRARLLELHLRRGDLDASTAGLAWRATCARSSTSAACRRDRARQLEERRQARASLRAGPEPQPTRTSPSTTGSRFCRRACASRATRPRSRAGVLVVERWILARLRNRTFFSLGELNAAIAELLERLNTRPFKKLEGCRRSRFLELDQPALRPLAGAALRVRRVAEGQGAPRLSHRGRAARITPCRTA